MQNYISKVLGSPLPSNTALALTSKDMLPAMENFIQFGSAHMVQNPAYIDAVIEIIRDIFEDKKVGGVDRICGCKLAESLMLSLRGHVDEHIGDFIRIAMTTLQNSELKVKSYRIHLMEVVINAIYYNPQLALSILEMTKNTNAFFSTWFGSIDDLTRVHDKKLSIAAIISLLTIPPQSIPQSVQQGWPRLLHGLVKLFETLPKAMQSTCSFHFAHYDLANDHRPGRGEEGGRIPTQ